MMIGANVEPKVVHATCVVERSFSKPVSVVFAALSDPNKVRRWMGGSEHSELFEFGCEFREGARQGKVCWWRFVSKLDRKF